MLRSCNRLGCFVETESGKNNHRKQLRTALRDCRLKNATVIIARLDRLSRDAGFLMTLQNARTDFVALDARYADKAMIGVMAIMAQKERESISARTSAALQAAKARGVTLGTPRNLTTEAQDKGRLIGRAKCTASANTRTLEIFEVMALSQPSGLRRMITNRQLATREDHTQPSRWHFPGKSRRLWSA